MNINEIFNKVKSQFSRVTGKTFDENLSETEVLAEMENMPSLAEQSATYYLTSLVVCFANRFLFDL